MRRGVSVLPNYRLYRLDGAGKITAAEWLSAEDDGHATQLAEKLDSHTTVEVWDRNRLIARVRPGTRADG